ncbi:HEPN domain-containing protein [bacterium]|jgi:uncharacterized protein (UPF0332 family)|nr:HEPN domain-containing protein [bacterium]
MREISQQAKDLSIYRLERAKEDRTAAENNLGLKDLRTAVNRAYYAIFHALRAVLALDEYDSKKHSGIISEFRLRYVKTGIFDEEISDMIGKAFQVRNKSDYEDMYIVSRNDTEIQIQNAKTIIDAVEKYLKNEKIIG